MQEESAITLSKTLLNWHSSCLIFTGDLQEKIKKAINIDPISAFRYADVFKSAQRIYFAVSPK